MAKLTRVFQKIFGNNASTNEVGVFGSLAEGTPQTSKDPSLIQSLGRFTNGWFSAVLGMSNPCIEDLNSLFFLGFRQLAYLFQQGIPEWNDETEYHEGSLVNVSGEIYKSLVNDNLNNEVSDNEKWANVLDANSLDFKSFSDLKMEDILPIEDSEDGFSRKKVSYLDLIEKRLTKMALDNWTLGNTGGNQNWFDVAYGKGFFVAVSPSGGNNLAISPNGEEWDHLAFPDSTWKSIAYGNGYFVALSDSTNTFNPRVLIWGVDSPPVTNNEGGTGSYWMDIAFGGGVFVGVGDYSGDNSIMSSSDNGTTWTGRSDPFDGQQPSWYGVTYGLGKFVAVGIRNGGVALMSSTDGENWTARTPSHTRAWNKVAFGNGVFLCTNATNGSISSELMISTNGEDWVSSSISVSGVTVDFSGQEVASLAFGGGMFVVIFSSGSIFYSPDGENWNFTLPSPSVDVEDNWRATAFGKGKFISLSANLLTANDKILRTISTGL